MARNYRILRSIPTQRVREISPVPLVVALRIIRSSPVMGVRLKTPSFLSLPLPNYSSTFRLFLEKVSERRK
jgi:hypothetical protein